MAEKSDENVDNVPEAHSSDNELSEFQATDALPSDDNGASNERVDLIQPYFEDKGFSVHIHGGGAHFRCAERNCVEMENGKEFSIKLSNTNPYGCDVDVKTARLDGEYDDVGGWRLVAGEENFTIRNSVYGQGKFVFYNSDPGKMEGDTNTKNYQENLKSIFEITFTPQAYSIYFRMIGDKAVTNIRVLTEPKNVNLEYVLEKWVKKKKLNEDYSGWCFYDGQKILRTVSFLSSVADKQDIKKPLLLLKKEEKISVKSSDGDEIKEIEFEPLEIKPLDVLLEKVPLLFGEGDYEFKVGGQQVTKANCFECLEADFVEVIKKPKPVPKPIEAAASGDTSSTAASGETSSTAASEKLRGIELTRGLDVGKQRGLGSSSGYRGVDDVEEEETFDIFHTHQYRDIQNPTEGVVRYEGDPVQAFQAFSTSERPFYTSYDDKVVITIHLVPTV